MASGSCQVFCHLGFKAGFEAGNQNQKPARAGYPPPAQLVNKAMRSLVIWKRLALCGGDHVFCFPWCHPQQKESQSCSWVSLLGE